MTFASRRTGIYERSEIEKILADDGYVEIPLSKTIAGDIIIYFGEDGDAEHSGVVVTSAGESQLGVPRVLSKWGKYAEFVHWANQCPYTLTFAKYFRISLTYDSKAADRGN